MAAQNLRLKVIFNLAIRGTIFFKGGEDFFIRIEDDPTAPKDKKLCEFLAAHSLDQQQWKKKKVVFTTFDMKDTSYRPQNILQLVDLLRTDGVGVKES